MQATGMLSEAPRHLAQSQSPSPPSQSRAATKPKTGASHSPTLIPTATPPQRRHTDRRAHRILSCHQSLGEREHEQPSGIKAHPPKVCAPVEMGAGGSTGCPDPSEDFAFGDLLAGLYPISL